MDLKRLRVPGRVWLVYFAIYIPVGFFMNAFGKAAHIAEFRYWWQVLTCYGLYLVPWSLYLHGLFALGVLELAGYSLGTSVHHPGNIIDSIFSQQNFSLAMVMWFALYLPAGNWCARRVLHKAHIKFP